MAAGALLVGLQQSPGTQVLSRSVAKHLALCFCHFLRFQPHCHHSLSSPTEGAAGQTEWCHTAWRVTATILGPSTAAGNGNITGMMHVPAMLQCCNAKCVAAFQEPCVTMRATRPCQHAVPAGLFLAAVINRLRCEPPPNVSCPEPIHAAPQVLPRLVNSLAGAHSLTALCLHSVLLLGKHSHHIFHIAIWLTCSNLSALDVGSIGQLGNQGKGF